MGNVNIKKRGSVYQYEFEVPKITSKRRRITKSGFKTKREAMEAGLIAQHNFFYGAKKEESTMFYDLRGSFATVSLRNGCEIKDIAEVLGHKRIETTENYYVSSTEKIKDVLQNLLKKV